MVSRGAEGDNVAGDSNEVFSAAGRKSAIVPKFTSRLGGGPGFVAELLADWTRRGLRMPADLFLELGSARLMRALEGQPALRSRVLEHATGAHPRVAARKSAASAAEDLEIALEEGATSYDLIFDLLGPDEWVTALGASVVWSFLTADSFWTERSGPSQNDDDKERVVQVAKRAVRLGLWSPELAHPIVNKTQIIESLTPSELRGLLHEALTAGETGRSLTLAHVFDSCPKERWLEAVAPELLWQAIAPRLEAFILEAPGRPQRRTRTSQPPKKPTLSTPQDRPSSNPPPPSLRNLDGEAARVCTQLASLDRLPPHFGLLPLTVLQSIESMYSELACTPDPNEQFQIVCRAFEDDEQRCSGLLALLELLNPKLLVTTPTLTEEAADSLSIRLLHEERSRAGAEDSADEPNDIWTKNDGSDARYAKQPEYVYALSEDDVELLVESVSEEIDSV